jgi:hypothetical protein
MFLGQWQQREAREDQEMEVMYQLEGPGSLSELQ